MQVRSLTDCDLYAGEVEVIDNDENELLGSESLSEVNDALRLMNLPISGSDFYGLDSSYDDDE